MTLSDLDEKQYLQSLEDAMKAQETATNYLVHGVKIIGVLVGVMAVASGYSMVTGKMFRVSDNYVYS